MDTTLVYQCFLVIHLEINNSLQATLSSIICVFMYGQSCQVLHGNNKSVTSMHLMPTGGSEYVTWQDDLFDIK